MPDRGGGQVVNILAFYSDDPSSNPAEVYNFSVKLLKRTKINKKKPGLAHLKKVMSTGSSWLANQSWRPGSNPAFVWTFL